MSLQADALILHGSGISFSPLLSDRPVRVSSSSGNTGCHNPVCPLSHVCYPLPGRAPLWPWRGHWVAACSPRPTLSESQLLQRPIACPWVFSGRSEIPHRGLYGGVRWGILNVSPCVVSTQGRGTPPLAQRASWSFSQCDHCRCSLRCMLSVSLPSRAGSAPSTADTWTWQLLPTASFTLSAQKLLTGGLLSAHRRGGGRVSQAQT